MCPCRCQELRYLNVTQCRVSEAGVGGFLLSHPLLADLLYEDTVGALAVLSQAGHTPTLSLQVSVETSHWSRPAQILSSH